MEAKICNALKFNFNYVTPYQFVHRFLRASHVSSRCSTSASLLPGDELGMIHNGANNEINVLLKKLVLYLLDLAVLEYELVKNKPSLTTAAAVYLARATLGIRESSTFASAPSSPLFEVPTNTTDNSNDTFNSIHDSSRKSKGYWSKTLEYYTGYDVKDLEESVHLLHRLQENAEDGWVFNKHKGNKCKRVATKTVLREDELGFL